MNSNELFKLLMEKNDLTKAYAVAKNIYCRNVGDLESFETFADLALRMASFDIALEERKTFLNEVSNSLVVFSESVEITEEILNKVYEYEEKIHNVFESIDRAEVEHLCSIRELNESMNTELLLRLGELNDDLKNAETQDVFDKKIKEVTEIEQKIQKEFFTEEQMNTYEVLTKCFSDTISRTMEVLNRKSLIEINRKAILSFKKAFDEFVCNKSKYKDSPSNLKSLMVTTLFAYDSRDLLNESLVYYNYVYSMIFNDVSNELKYKLTEWSINTERMKR